MLHEGEPAVGRLLDVLGVALVEIRGMHFLELALLGIHGEADEALRAEGFGYGIRVRVGFAVVRQLKVRVRGERRGARIADLERDVDHVAAAPEGIDLLYL